MGEAVGATIQTVLDNLLSIAVEEFNLFRYFKKDLEKLKGSVLMIQDFLYDAEKKQVTDKAVNRWLKDLESVAFEADNVFGELNYQLLRNKMEKKSKTFFTHSINPILFRLKMARKIKEINEKLKSINEEARGFGLKVMRPVGAGFDAIVGSETDSFTADPIVRGREDDVSRIVEKLTASPTEQVFSILPIVGMGGLGKTTLARLVFHHEKVNAHFDEQIWVYVSQTFDVVIIFKKMLESLTAENNLVEFGNREAILKKLKLHLDRKRFLLVLDDVWNEGSEKWDDFLNSLSGITSATGNGIIITTRGQNVASIVKTLPVHELEGLPEDECWSIIKSKAFIQGEVPSYYETIGRNIAERCQGLPLAAKVVGGLLRNKSKDEWLSIEETWLSKFGEGADAISKVLRYSFDQLSSPSLKKCFAYCSIFPKGFSIKREQLIELWMAEGFLAIDQSNDLETRGNKFFNLLVQNSLLQIVKKDDYGNITTCNMHDLVHDLASSVLGSKSNGASDKSLDDIHQFRYIAKSCSIPEDARHVRTLIFQIEVSDNMFRDFKSLHVLVLWCRDVRELPGSISKLIHLRLLDISYTRIESLPKSIGKLYHLQTLRTITYPNPKLPNTLKNLISLRHLHIPKIELPPEIGRLTCLQTLRFFQVGNEKGYRIGELGSLKDLKGELVIGNLERVADKEEANSAHLIRKQNISMLKFAWNESRKDETNDKNVLEGLQPHPNLKSLKIYGFKGKSLPSWTLKMEVRDDLDGYRKGLDNLMEIKLKSCGECEEIPMLGHLPHLKSICLNGLTNVRSMGSSFYAIDKGSRSTNKGAFCRDDKIVLFPALERFELMDMPNLKEWAEVEYSNGSETQQCEIVVFPCLEHLTMQNCRNLTSAPSHFPRLKELEIKEMDSPLPLAIICGSNLTSLTKLFIHGVKGLVCLPDALFSNNQNLLLLKIWDCPNLTHLAPSLRGGGAFLETLWVRGCPNLRELPEDLPGFSPLKSLDIGNCPNLKSIPCQGLTSLRELEIRRCGGLTNSASEMRESFSPSLESLDLIGLTSLTNPHMVIGRREKLPRLTDLTIIDVPGILDFSKEIGSLHNLQRLRITVSSSDSLDYRLVREFFDDIFKRLHSLQCLELRGYENWDSLPGQLQCVTALSDFWLIGFGIEALPEWLGNMSSLQCIVLYDCAKLRRLPSKEAMQRLTKLTSLYINNCPLLNVQSCSEQQSHDSQWPNISHIPFVYVNGRPI